MKKSYSLLIVMILFLFTSFSNIFAQTAKPRETSALLYEISGKDLKKPSYIFGTMHLICPNDMISSDKFDKYINETERIIMELDLDDQTELQSMSKAAFLPDGKMLADYFTAGEYAKVTELVKNYLGIPIENVKNFHPMILQTMITTSPKIIGCSPPGSYEISFMQIAAAKKKPIEGLETVAMQIETINASPLDKQAENLYKMALNPNVSVDEFKAFIETYKSQDSDKLYEFVQKYFAQDPTFQVSLLDDRNTDWIPKIEKAVKEKSSFIAVGAGHLGGKMGVLNLLKEKDYKVKAIKL